jgi:hypothetical protein
MCFCRLLRDEIAVQIAVTKTTTHAFEYVTMMRALPGRATAESTIRSLPVTESVRMDTLGTIRPTNTAPARPMRLTLRSITDPMWHFIVSTISVNC